MKKKIINIFFLLAKLTPGLKFFYKTRNTQTPCRPWYFFMQKILGFNKHAYWPVHFTSKVSSPENIYAGIDVSPGYMPGCYIYGSAGIYIGDYTQIAPNVGILSANHDIHDNRKQVDNNSPIIIGDYSWIGMNSTILANVVLGDHTIVAAGSVVTKSFSEGHCVLGGVPAKKIKSLSKPECVKFQNEIKYNGYIDSNNFESYRKKKLRIKPYKLIRKKYGLENQDF